MVVYNTNMKKRIGLFMLIVAIFAVSFFVVTKNNQKTAVSEIPKNTHLVLGVSEPLQSTVTFKEEKYKVFYTPFFEGEKLHLISNFEEKKTANEIKIDNGCSFLVNGGFYTQEARPVGYFKSSDVPLRDEKNSLLFDAFFTINDLRTPRITRNIPKDPLVLGIQVGPLLVENSIFLPLSIRNDKQARRVVLGINGENKVIFLTIVKNNSDYSGPLMADLPIILQIWSEKSGIQLADAVNLDGGSASSFLTPDISLTEISPIGSAFCIKD